jgi:hypothetical protein
MVKNLNPFWTKAGGLFAAAAIQHAQIFPMYFPIGRGRIVAGSRPLRVKRVG